MIKKQLLKIVAEKKKEFAIILAKRKMAELVGEGIAEKLDYVAYDDRVSVTRKQEYDKELRLLEYGSIHSKPIKILRQK